MPRQCVALKLLKLALTLTPRPARVHVHARTYLPTEPIQSCMLYMLLETGRHAHVGLYSVYSL